MHESGLIASLAAQASRVAEGSGAPVRSVGLRIGALSGISEMALRTHWQRLAPSNLRDAELVIEEGDDLDDVEALGVSLAFIEVGPPTR